MIFPISASSWVPSTVEWLDRICSSSVEPVRGSPTIEAGLIDGADLKGDPFSNPGGEVYGFTLTGLGKAMLRRGPKVIEEVEAAAWESIRAASGGAPKR